MSKYDLMLLEKYAMAIFGCAYNDLSDKEAAMLIAHVRECEPDFENYRGV